MSKNTEILDKLIKNTENNTIIWKKAPKPEIGWLSIKDHWKGETKLTENKKLIFILNYNVDDYNLSEIEVYFINIKENNRTLIENIEPGIFSFRTISKLKKLIKLVNRKEIDKIHDSEKNKDNKTDMGPFLNKDWEEIVY